jgi:hypothetical protein
MAISIHNPADTQGANRVADVGPIPDDPAANYVTTLTRGGPGGKVDTITLTKDSVSWVKTLTYTGLDVTGVSAWVRV